jgi:endonuclease/exonuclease/phosphatase family metal-dependent hydrolase
MNRRFGDRILRLASAFLVAATAAALTTGSAMARDSNPTGITVMTQNMFQGTELGEVIAAHDVPSFLAAVTTDFQQVQASRIPERTAAMANEIAANRPDLVGLQEVALWQTGPFNQPPATRVAYDMLQSLIDALEARGQHYAAVAVTINTVVEAPSTLGIDIRYSDRVAILARRGVHVDNVQQRNYAARLTVPTAVGPVSVTDGWASVDVGQGGNRFRFVTTHLSGIAPPIQVLEGAELLAGPAQTSLPLIVTGDFNSSATPGGVDATPTYGNMLAGGLRDAWATAQAGEPGLTCCQRVPDLRNPVSTLAERIDFVFHRGALRPEEAQVVGASPADKTASGLWPSDHAGIAARLSLGEGAD